MADEPPTDLGTVWVTGQRRRPSGAFPTRGGGGGGSANEPGSPNQWELEEEDPQSPEGHSDPCADPVTALEWNADAAAAEAFAKFKAKAAELGDTGLYQREFGAQIYQRPDGSIYLGPVTWGDPMTGTFDFDESGATQGNLVGEIHSHPSPQMDPSVADWTRLNTWSDWTQRNFRTYIVSRNENDPTSDFAIRAYDKSSDQSTNSPGPEVNPEATPCP